MATTYDLPKANVTNMIRNTMFRSGVIGQSLQQKYGKITDKEVVDILQNQISELNKNNVTLSSIDTIARRISNNVFALAKLMQKLYELKIREKMLADRERFRQEAFQEEARFESLVESDDTQSSKYQRVRKRNEKSTFLTMFDAFKTIAAVGSIAALGFKKEVNEFLEKAEKWFDETFEETKNSIQTFVDDARNFIDQSIDGYIDTSSEEVKLNQEEDVETDRIVNEINTALEEEDRRINLALGIEEDEERDLTDIVPRESITQDVLTNPTVSPEITRSDISSDSLSSYVDPGEMAIPAPAKISQPTILDFMSKEGEPTTANKPLVAPITSASSSDYSSPSMRESDSISTPSLSPARSELSRTLTENINKPSMLMPSVGGQLFSPMPSSSTGYQQSFGNYMQNMNMTPTALDSPQMSVPTSGLINSNMPDVGIKISETSFGNKMARNYTTQPSKDNTTIVSSGNVDALRPGVEHYVPSPVANRGSLEIGVRFNATA